MNFMCPTSFHTNKRYILSLTGKPNKTTKQGTIYGTLKGGFYCF